MEFNTAAYDGNVDYLFIAVLSPYILKLRMM